MSESKNCLKVKKLQKLLGFCFVFRFCDMLKIHRKAGSRTPQDPVICLKVHKIVYKKA